MSQLVIVLAVLLALAHLIDHWPDYSGSRPVRLAHASTSGQDQSLTRPLSTTGAGKLSVPRRQSLVTFSLWDMPSRSAIS